MAKYISLATIYYIYIAVINYLVIILSNVNGSFRTPIGYTVTLVANEQMTNITVSLNSQFFYNYILIVICILLVFGGKYVKKRCS